MSAESVLMPPHEELAAIWSRLNADEQRVVVRLAQRLLAGQREHGKLDIVNDRRDWRKERGQEIEDLLMYSAFESLKREV